MAKSKSSPDPVKWTICKCGHPEHIHYGTPSGRFVCAFATSGTTTRGVIGLPYSHRCPCENYFVPERDKEKS